MPDCFIGEQKDLKTIRDNGQVSLLTAKKEAKATFLTGFSDIKC